MNKSLLTLTAAAFLLATSLGSAQAQSTDDDDTMQRGQGMMQQGQRGQGMMQRGQRMMQQGMQRGQRMSQRGTPGQRGYGRHHGKNYEKHHRRGGGMGGGMGHGAMMQILFALMDADGSGTLSLEEVQEAHARIFAHMDADGDGQLTKQEIRDFFHGGKDSRRAGAMGDADGLNLTDEVGEDDNETITE